MTDRRSAAPFALAMAAGLMLASCSGGGGGGSSGSPTPGVGSTPGIGSTPTTGSPTGTSSATSITSLSSASKFMSRSGLGATSSDLQSLNNSDAAGWLQQEFSKPATPYLAPLLQRAAGGESLKNTAPSFLVWDALVSADDELRQRMVFALSQLIVVSDNTINDPLAMAYYLDILSRNAFGNYRDLLQEITYSPAMAEYLTYLRNRKGDPATGRMPDENYARELLQLFTIGLVELNMDGTPRLGANGEIETFDNDDIVGLARVFTGFSLKGSGFWDADPDGAYNPLQSFVNQHSDLPKSFLGTTIPAGTLPDQSVELALDHIFNHSNVAPFVSRQLIQRFTQSNPDPAYVQRVATAFEAGQYTAGNGSVFGTGERGDLQATLAAILLDASLFDDSSQNQTTGKIREPILRFAHMARAFNTSNVDSFNEWWLWDTRDPTDRLGQHPMRSPSVFNFYRPGYIAPGTASGAAGLTAPELQIVNEGSTIGYLNFMSRFAFDQSPQRDSALNTFVPNYATELALADDPRDLINHLNTLLTGDRLTTDRVNSMVNVVSAYTIRDGREDDDRLKRVQIAIWLVVSSPEFAVVQ